MTLHFLRALTALVRPYWVSEERWSSRGLLAIIVAMNLAIDWLFLDEATSALDEGSEERLYRLLRERLPDAALVSIGHRSTLAAFHEHRLDLAGGHYPRVPIAVSGQYACDAVAAMK